MLSEGIFNMTKSKEDRIKIIEEFTGPLKKGAIEMLDTEWGTAEYFEKRGRKEGREDTINKTVNILKKLGISDDEIQQHLKEEGLVTE